MLFQFRQKCNPFLDAKSHRSNAIVKKQDLSEQGAETRKICNFSIFDRLLQFSQIFHMNYFQTEEKFPHLKHSMTPFLKRRFHFSLNCSSFLQGFPGNVKKYVVYERERGCNNPLFKWGRFIFQKTHVRHLNKGEQP